ncbi:MAG: hypothetical protein AAGF27_10725 [Pseudomonadota bacterium]
MSGALTPKLRLPVVAFAAAAVCLTGYAAPVLAQDAGSDDAPSRSCLADGAGASQAAIDAFFGNPASLLQENPLGGLSLSNDVRSLATTNVDTVPVILALEATATLRQARAIGAGLARAATLCVATNPDLAAEIQLAVAASDNEALVTAFLTGAGDEDTAAVPGGLGDTTGGGGPAAAGITSNPGGGAAPVTPASATNAGAGPGAFGGGNAGDDNDTVVQNSPT